MENDKTNILGNGGLGRYRIPSQPVFFFFFFFLFLLSFITMYHRMDNRAHFETRWKFFPLSMIRSFVEIKIHQLNSIASHRIASHKLAIRHGMLFSLFLFHPFVPLGKLSKYAKFFKKQLCFFLDRPSLSIKSPLAHQCKSHD